MTIIVFVMSAVGLTLLILLTLIVLFTRLFLSVVTVSGPSMEPTLIQGDRLLVLRHWPQMWLRNRQIVIIDLSRGSISHDYYLPGEIFIKRVVGLPGDTITIHISELHEIVSSRLRYKCDGEGNLSWRIPPGHCFVRGDACLSEDSIKWGPIPFCTLVGIVLLKLPRKAVSMNSHQTPQDHSEGTGYQEDNVTSIERI